MIIAGRYRKLEILGGGGMGSVYLVEDTLHPGEKLALKTQRLDDEDTKDEGTRRPK